MIAQNFLVELATSMEGNGGEKPYLTDMLELQSAWPNFYPAAAAMLPPHRREWPEMGTMIHRRGLLGNRTSGVHQPRLPSPLRLQQRAGRMK